jgi:predicted dehydrogenase
MRVLFIGLGSIARKHIAAIKEIDDSVIIYALRSNQDAKIITDVINIYSFEDLSNLKLDFAILSNPTACHFQSLNQLKDLDIPLFIEKPLFGIIGKAQDELVSTIIGNKTPTYVACNLRFLESIVKMKEIIESERVNEVNVYCGSYLPDWRPGVDFKTVYSANKELGGGVHIDLIHELDYVYWLFGNPKQTKSFFRNNSSLNISAYDYANYLWEYDKFAVSIVLNYYRKDAKRSLEVLCESGTYTVDLLCNTISFNNKIIFESTQAIGDTYINQMNFFLQQVLHNGDDFNSIDQAYKILKLCLID